MTIVQTRGVAAAGFSTSPRCVADALREACSGLPRVAFALVFPPHTMPPEAVTAEAADGAPDVPWAGMSSDGVIGADGSVRRGCAAIAFDASVRVGVGVGGDVASDPREAAARATEAACAALDGEEPSLLLLFFDPAPSSHAKILLGAYDVAGPDVPVAGGGANASLAAGPDGMAQFAEGAAHRDSVVCVALASPAPIGIGTGHGCVPTGIPAVVTGSSGRIVHAINGRAAEDVYLEEIGHGRQDLTDEEFERLAVVHPLVQLGLRAVRPRHVLGRAPGGGLRCAAHVPENAAVGFSEQTPGSILVSAEEAVERALEPLGAPPRAILLFDCAARRGVLGTAADIEMNVIRAALPEGTPFVGLYTRGEVARVRGASGDLNHAIVAVAFA
jgi:hypothetical protein